VNNMNMQSEIDLKPSRFVSAASERKLAAYLAASAGTLVASEAQAVVVSNSSVQPFGINGAVPIDFNSDGQVDYEIDHDRVDLGGGNVIDYLQLDKNDINGAPPAENPLPTDFLDTFDLNGTDPNDTIESAYVYPVAQGDYPSALLAGFEIGPGGPWDFQEGDNFQSSGKTIRANRLIDEDRGQVDMQLGGLTAEQIHLPTNGPNFVGLGEEVVRYLGVKMDFENVDQVHYGWIGIRITNEADATGAVVGWGYETEVGVSILAGETGIEPGQPGDFNGDGKVDAADYVKWRKTDSANEALYTEWRSNFGEPPAGAGLAAVGAGNHGVPEPSSLLLALGTGICMLATFFWRRITR
jgi:hypothetical protein